MAQKSHNIIVETIDKSAIFIACPSDLHKLREDIEKQISSRISEFGRSDDLEIYSYDLDFADRKGGLNHRRPIQQQIPRPSDSRFCAIICLMSEVAGTPLHDASELPPALLTEWTELGLRNPWPTTPDKRAEALRSGQFPLTGTIFEFLESQLSTKPMFMAFIVGSNHLPPDDPDAELGGYAYRTEASSYRSDFDDWLKDEYDPQILAVRNFYKALKKHNLHSKICACLEDAKNQAVEFVTNAVIYPDSRLGVNPYRDLGSYDVADGAFLAGRDDAKEQLANQLIGGFKPGKLAPQIVITGKSGSGKSSLLRAGVLAGLNDSKLKLRSRYVTLQFRPDDFPRMEEAVTGILEKILYLFSKCPGVALNSADLVTFMQPAKDGRAAALAQIICESLRGPSGISDTCLVVGIDQFDEIVDDLTLPLSPLSRELQWAPLMDFVREGRKTERIGFALTLDSFRKQHLPNLLQEYAITEVTNDDTFYRIVISQPFAKSGYPLHEDVREKIFRSFCAVREKVSFGNWDSLLPLLAVTLSQLFDYLVEKRPLKPKDDKTAEDNFDAKIIELNDIRDFDLDDIEHAISKTADEAYKDALADSITAETGNSISTEELGYFLRPLVRVADSTGTSLELRFILEPSFKQERDLIYAFLRRGLIIRSGKYFRLVNEAVVHFWKPARDWFNESRSLLVVERQFREDAFDWEVSGRTSGKLKLTTERTKRIGYAAEILNYYIRTWSPTSALTPNQRLARDYCLALLEYSETPRARVESSPSGIMHVHVAATYNFVSLLQKFKDLDPQCLDLPASTGRTPLGRAAWASPEAVKFLLDENCDPLHKEDGGELAIFFPIIQGNQHIFELLLDRYPIHSLADGPRGWTPLHECAYSNRKFFAQRLIEDIGISPSLHTAEHLSPLHVAAQNGATEVFNYLLPLSDPSAKTKNKVTPLILAAVSGHEDIVRTLLSDGRVSAADIRAHDKDGWQALHWAAYKVKAAVVTELVSSSSVDVNCRIIDKIQHQGKGPTALHLAASNGAIEIVKTLLAAPSCNPNLYDQKGKTPLGNALAPTGAYFSNRNSNRANHDSVIELLLSDQRLNPGLPCQPDGPTPLEIAVERKLWTIFVRFIARANRADLKRRSGDDKTLLLLAVENNAPMFIVEILIKQDSGALNHLSKNGKSPLIQALEIGRSELVERLLKTHKIKVDLRSEIFGSALHVAARHGAPGDLLSRLWHEPLHVDKLGWTPLHLAAAAGHIETTRWLIGRNPSLADDVDGWGRKFYDVAPRHLLEALEIHKTGRHLPANTDSWERPLQWERLTADDYERIFEVCAGVIGERNLVKRTEILSTPLPFYPKRVRLLSFSDPARQGSLRLFALWHGRTSLLQHLNGTSPPIHKMNSEVTLILNKITTLDYLRFFCFFVRGDDGPFLISESIAQPEIARITSEKSRSDLELHCRQATFWGVDELGKQRVSGIVYYGKTLLFANFLIDRTGMIEMEYDMPILEHLPNLIYAPVT